MDKEAVVHIHHGMQNFKRNLLILYKKGKNLTLVVCFLLLLSGLVTKRERKIV